MHLSFPPRQASWPMPRLLPTVVLLHALAVPARAADPGSDYFTSKVRPILAAHCFKCHGPDDGARKARLRLDVREEALRKRAIVPGKPKESHLVARITSDDPTEIMPPPGAKLPLSDEQKQVLERWIAGGANYTTHWAFV